MGICRCGDFASAEATGAVAGSHDLLKKVDQNFKKGKILGC